MAAVQEETATACGAPTQSANSRSNAATSGPVVTQPEASTRVRGLPGVSGDLRGGERDAGEVLSPGLASLPVGLHPGLGRAALCHLTPMRFGTPLRRRLRCQRGGEN